MAASTARISCDLPVPFAPKITTRSPRSIHFCPVRKQGARVGGGDGGIVQGDQRLGMGAGIGQFDRARRGFAVGGAGGGLQLFGAVFQLFGLGDQQIRARVDADVFQLGGLAAQLVGLVQIILKAARSRRRRFPSNAARARE